MKKLFKYNFPPEGFGVAVCALLMCSRHLGVLESAHMQALNHVLVVFILCVCVHLVRRTAALTHIHVWNDKLLSVLWGMPVLNLIVTALQLVLGEKPFFSSFVFVTVFILLSLPTFFMLYFVFACRKLCGEKVFKISCIVLWCYGAVYTVIRIFDRVAVPLLTASGAELNEKLIKFLSASSELSIWVYVLSIVCFGILYYCRVKKTLNRNNVSSGG